MTEKRFKIVDKQFISYYGGTGYKISNEECGFWLWHNKNESQKVCDKLNSILDENEQLRKENDMLSCELSVSANKEISRNCRIAELEEENKELKQYKQSVNDVLKSWSQKNVTAKQLQVVLAIMEELNVIGDVE